MKEIMPSFMKEKIKHFIILVTAKLWLAVFSNKKDLLLICSWGIGDTLFIRFFVEQLFQEKKKQISILCRSHTAMLFKDAECVSKVIADNRMAKWMGYYCRHTKNTYNDRYIYCHFSDISDAFGERHSSIVEDYYKDILRLSGKPNIAYPCFNSPDAEEIIRTKCIDKNSVILCPGALSGTGIPEGFWQRLADQLINNHFTVFTNVGMEKEKVLPGTKTLCETLEATAAISEKCAAMICARSGICDLLACTDCRLFVLNNLNVTTHRHWGSAWDVNHFSRNPVITVNYEQDCEAKLIAEIIEYACKGRNEL